MDDPVAETSPAATGVQLAALPPADSTPAWADLIDHQASMAATSLRDLFTDSSRARQLTSTAGDLTVDFSKHLVTETTLDRLLALAAQTRLVDQRNALFDGALVNTTEHRPALHTALRSVDPVLLDGVDVVPGVRDVLDRMRRLASRVRSGDWTGATGKRIQAIVNIGIGGSDLGPLMVTNALRHVVHSELDVRFVSNVDSAHLDAALTGLDPATTLFIVASKSFTTIETMTNARAARAWVLAGLGTAMTDPGADEAAAVVADHFVAVSTNHERVADFGIDPSNVFEFWDWVGGRYSVDAAIGLSVMCAIGADAFDEFLAGFRTIDDHVRHAPLRDNAPTLAALIGIWYRNFWGWQTHAVLPYAQALDRFPAYLQQLDMESNGKATTHGGEALRYDTGPIVWGEPGTNGQHAFFQLLHQGTTPVPCDFIGFLEPEPTGQIGIDGEQQHRLLFANMVAQAEALAFGKTRDEVAAAGVEPHLVAHRTFPGNRPSTTITAPALTPSVLGQLIAFYEHRVATQGAVWGINSFDQWGVELGKVLATRIADELDPARGADGSSGIDATEVGGRAVTASGGHDVSTSALIERYRAHRRS